jgi:hypothetical protein
MSFADYTALKAAIASDWLHRTDLTTAIGDFIALFESDFNADMRVRQMETETAQISTAGYLLHPTGWIGWKEIRGTNGGVQYNLEPASDEVAIANTGGDAVPARLYKVKGSRTYLYPAASAVTFPCTYYTGVGLTGGTNWLLTAYPGAYLYGSLLQATASIGDDPRVPMWSQAFEKALQRIRDDSKKQEWSGQVLRMRPDFRVV